MSKAKVLDFEALARLARRNATVAIEAADEEQLDLELREVSPEEILEACAAAGVAEVTVKRDADGVIQSIHACVGVPIGEGGIIPSIEATGPKPAQVLGDLAQTSVSVQTSVTGATTTGSATVTLTTAPPANAIDISGPGIPAGTTIVSVAGDVVTMSASATATAAAAALTITAETQVLGLAEWTIDWKRKTADATTTDSDTYESSLPSTASWSVKAKYMFIDGDTTQSANILATVSAPVNPSIWNFFPTLAAGRSAFSGSAYVDGITIASGMGKVVGLDVSLKGTGPLTVGTQLAPIANPATGTGQQAIV